MRGFRIPVGIVMPVLLVGVLAGIGTLQYRWLGKVSEAERAQLSRGLTQRARDLADDFDREITRLYLAVQSSQAASAPADGAPLAAALDAWRQVARYPQMVRAVYLAERADGAMVLRRFDAAARAFEPVPLAAWPVRLEPLRATLLSRPEMPPVPGMMPGPAGPAGAGTAGSAVSTVAPGASAPGTGAVAPTVTVTGAATTMAATASTRAVALVAVSQAAVAADVPALVVPLVNGAAAEATTTTLPTFGRATFRWLDVSRLSVIVELDESVLTGVMLPALADRYFPASDADAYRLAVTNAAGRARFTRGPASGATVEASAADVVQPFFGLRFDLAPEWMPRADRPEGEAGRPQARADRVSFFIDASNRGDREANVRIRTANPTRAATGWTLLLQHQSGSLDAAVTHARRRNLALVFGMLAVLGAGMLLVVRNARRAEHLAAKQMDFVATVSHELRTPLAVIRSAAQNLSAGVIADPQQARRYGDLIDAEGRRLTDMVEQVLDYAGLEGQSRVRAPRPVDVAGVVEAAVAACRPVGEAAGCTLAVDLGDPDSPAPPVMGDEAALGRVVTNLVTNAVKHGGDGHWVGVTVSSCVVKGGREVVVTVSDRGRGIDAAELPQIFEPFQRGRHALDQQIHGNGLGLTLVRRIVEAHGGRVAVTSAPGQGATFVVYLPAIPDAGASGSGGGAA